MNVNNWIARLELIKDHVQRELDEVDTVDADSFDDLVDLIEEILDVLNKGKNSD